MVEIWCNALPHSFGGKESVIISGRLLNPAENEDCVFEIQMNFPKIYHWGWVKTCLISIQCICLKMKEEKKLLRWKENRSYFIWEEKLPSVIHTQLPLTSINFHLCVEKLDCTVEIWTSLIVWQRAQGFHKEFNNLDAERIIG